MGWIWLYYVSLIGIKRQTTESICLHMSNVSWFIIFSHFFNFAGLFPRLVKVAPSCAIMISSYEFFKLFFAGKNEAMAGISSHTPSQSFSPGLSPGDKSALIPGSATANPESPIPIITFMSQSGNPDRPVTSQGSTQNKTSRS